MLIASSIGSNFIGYYKFQFFNRIDNIFKSSMQKAEDQVEKIEYTKFEQLTKPSFQTISQQTIELGFESKEWFINFQTITALRQANRFYSSVFINELLPNNIKNMIHQVENLRSNNSKEALILLCQILQVQEFNSIKSTIMESIVESLFSKAAFDLKFIRTEALIGIQLLSKQSCYPVLVELCRQTQSNNAVIAELAIQTLATILEKNKVTEVDGKFLKNLSHNINGKRAVLQKKAKQILKGLKKRTGEEQLEQLIDKSEELEEQESNTLKREIKNTSQASKSHKGNFRDFLKAKKLQNTV